DCAYTESSPLSLHDALPICAHLHRGAIPVEFLGADPRISERKACARDGEVAEPVHAARRTRLDELGRLEVVDFRRDPRAPRLHVEAGDRAERRALTAESLPEAIDAGAHRRDRADARNGDTVHRAVAAPMHVRHAGPPCDFATLPPPRRRASAVLWR